MKIKAQIYVAALTAGLLVTACESNEETESKTTNNQNAVQVTLATPQRSAAALTQVSGALEPAHNAVLSTRMMGYVESIPAPVGTTVQKGQLLLNINAGELQAQLEQANAQIKSAKTAFNNAEKDFTRYKKLLANQSVTQREYEQVKQGYEARQAQLTQAKEQRKQVLAQLAYANIKAPFAGKVTQVMVEEGDMANPGQPLLAIEGSGNWEVVSRVSEQKVARLQPGAEVEVSIPALQQMFPATITSVSSSSRHSGGQYEVRAGLSPNEGSGLYSGMFARLQFADSTAPTSYYIARDALIRKGDLTGVYTVSQRGTAILHWLKLGQIKGDRVEVLTGLSPNEKYVKSYQGKMYNGAPIAQ